MRALKAIVIGMGALIVLAVGLIGFGLYKKSVEPGWKLFGTQNEAPLAALAVAAPPTTFDPVRLGLPETCSILEVRPDGPRVYLQVGPEPECESVIVLDAKDGRILGLIHPR